MGRPRFAADYPKDDVLDALLEAFDRGDYRAVREGAPKLAAATEDDAVRAAARDLRARIDPDPWAVRLLWLTGLLLLGLTVYWTVESNGPHPEPKRAAPADAPK